MRVRLSVFTTIGVAVSLAAAPLPASATPAQMLAQARESFQLRKYEEAVLLLTSLLYPEPQLSRERDLKEAHLLLGVAHLELGDDEAARRELDEALVYDSDIPLDPLLFSERAIAFLEARRKEFLERQRQGEEARAEAEARERVRKLLENTIVIERRPYFINFVPLGAGQFQNGHQLKGIALAVSQALFGGASLGLFAWQLGKYGVGGVVPDEEADTVRRLQQLQITTGALFLLLYGTGIVDALIHYESATRVPADPSLFPDDLQPDPAQPKNRPRESASPQTSLHLRLLVHPSGGGVAVTWEF